MKLPVFIITLFYVFTMTPTLSGSEDLESKIAVVPETIITSPRTATTISVKGGLPPYRWYTRSGEIQRTKQHEFIYTSPKRYGFDTVTFEDRAGQTITADVEVLRPLTVSPLTSRLHTKEKKTFSIYGGSGKWKIIQHDTLTIVEITKQRLTIQAGSLPGKNKIVIQDTKTGEIKKIEIEVYDDLKIEMNEPKPVT